MSIRWYAKSPACAGEKCNLHTKKTATASKNTRNHMVKNLEKICCFSHERLKKISCRKKCCHFSVLRDHYLSGKLDFGTIKEIFRDKKQRVLSFTYCPMIFKNSVILNFFTCTVLSIGRQLQILVLLDIFPSLCECKNFSKSNNTQVLIKLSIVKNQVVHSEKF